MLNASQPALLIANVLLPPSACPNAPGGSCNCPSTRPMGMMRLRGRNRGIDQVSEVERLGAGKQSIVPAGLGLTARATATVEIRAYAIRLRLASG